MKYRFVFFVLLLVFFTMYCNGMTENQVNLFTQKEVYSRSKVIELFKISVLSIKERCSNNTDALNYLINEGLADQFSRLFYQKNSVEACLVLFLSLECSSSTDISTQISYYINLIYHCKLKPVELFQ